MEENFWGASIKQSGPGVTQRFQDLLGWPCISKASEADRRCATCQDFHFWAFVFLLDRKAYALFLKKKNKTKKQQKKPLGNKTKGINLSDPKMLLKIYLCRTNTKKESHFKKHLG